MKHRSGLEESPRVANPGSCELTTRPGWSGRRADKLPRVREMAYGILVDATVTSTVLLLLVSSRELLFYKRLNPERSIAFTNQGVVDGGDRLQFSLICHWPLLLLKIFFHEIIIFSSWRLTNEINNCKIKLYQFRCHIRFNHCDANIVEFKTF